MEPRPFVEFRAHFSAHAKRIFRATFDDGEGLPEADRRVVLGARVVALLATIWIFAISFWEIGAPFGAGHYAAATAVTLGGENMLRFDIVGAVPRYLAEPPLPRDYYCHHPWGVFWTAALFVGTFGHHDFVCRLPAALMSSAMPFLLYGAGRALFSPVAGAIAAVAYVVTPITLAYASFFALEVPTMFAMALTTLATVRFLQVPRKRFAVLSVLGMVLAAGFDWTGFVFDAIVLGGLFVRGFVLRRWLPPLRFERFATLWASAVALVALLAVFHLVEFSRLGHLAEFLGQGEARASGSNLPLDEVLESRRYWILLAFTPLAVGLGKIAAPILLARTTLFRREGEFFPLAVLATATFQYVGFKQGADIHFFWPQYFALYFAYALGALAASAEEIGRHALVRFRRERLTPLLPWGVLVAGLVTTTVMIPDAVRALRWGRKSGGRFNEKGLIIHPDLDKSAVFAELARTLPEDATLGVDGSMKPSYWMDFTLKREVTFTSLPRSRARAATSHFALDARFSASEALRSLARDFSVVAYGPYWIAETSGPAEPIVG
ncbi:MAG TPA: glycosyltransferase family 39 protein, partial [Polyangiaceae bacterium]|nr:glycosyltransferase family 39 protein [Polyangiaceae bacterium]